MEGPVGACIHYLIERAIFGAHIARAEPVYAPAALLHHDAASIKGLPHIRPFADGNGLGGGTPDGEIHNATRDADRR